MGVARLLLLRANHLWRDRASRAHARGRPSGPVRLRALPRRAPGRSTVRSAASAAHYLCRGKGIDCPAADSCPSLFCILPLHSASACTDCQLLSSSVSKIRNLRRLSMRTPTRSILFCLFVFLISAISPLLHAQSNAGSISGVVTDPTGAVIPGATVSIENPVSQYTRSTTTDSTGHYSFSNLPFHPYHLIARGQGFASSAQDVDIRSAVQVVTNIGLKLGSAINTVTVTS